MTGLKYTGIYAAGSFMTCTGHPRAVKAINSKNVKDRVGSKVIWGVNSNGSYVDLIR
jgi:hypothetical protein